MAGILLFIVKEGINITMVENIIPLILKNTKNKKLLDNNIYINNVHTGTFYQILNASLLKEQKQENIAVDEESWEAIKNMLPKETQNYVAKAMALLDKTEKTGLNKLNNMETPEGPPDIKSGLENNFLKLKENPNPKERLKEQIAWAAKATGLPETLIIAVGQVESGLRHINPQTSQVIKSPAGALGIMQLMPATAKELGVNVYGQAENILGGAKYLALAWQKFHGKLELVLAGYNAGINRVKKAVQTTGEESWEAIKNMLPKETQNYVAKAMALLDKTEKTGLNKLNNMETPEDPAKIELALESNSLKLKEIPKNLPDIQSGLESNLLKFPQLKEIFSPQNLLLDEAMVLITNQEQGRGQNNNYTQGRWYSEQPYTPQNIKTKEVDLNLLTGEENSIFTVLEQVNSGLFQINRPVSLPELQLIIFSTLQNMPFDAEKTIIKLNLTPENLGSLAIKVTKQEDKLTIHFYTTSNDVKEIIEASFPQLKEALFRQNLLLDEAMVLITNQEQGEGQNNYTQGRWHSEQPYTPQNVKTKEVNLNLLTGEENSIHNVTTVNYWI
ncbi:MAG TPA: hypothetical protein DHV84_05420 [Desulfotomaculum sp.]|nr:hypothetical protein [Desulfotomaculum sp.]